MPPSPQNPADNSTSAPAPAPVVANPTITYDDFARIELRVATVLECAPLPKSDKLLALQVDLGGERRQILAGIKEHVDATSMVGKQIVVVANLAPRQMRGQVSQGMLLAATDAATGKVIVIGPSEPVGAGSKVS